MWPDQSESLKEKEAVAANRTHYAGNNNKKGNYYSNLGSDC